MAVLHQKYSSKDPSVENRIYTTKEIIKYEKFEVYGQATQSLVNLAFGLIVGVTIITVV